MLSVIEEIINGNLGRMEYIPKHPFITYGIDLATTAAGALGGYKYARENGLDPRSGLNYGFVNGSNLGQLSGEMIDRALRNHEGDPYKGRRKVDDATRDFLIATGVGNATTGMMRSHDLPLSGLGGIFAGEMAKNLYYGATEPAPTKRKKKK